MEYYFANKKNREILVRTKVVNRRNEIIDKDLCKMIEFGLLKPVNKFRLKKQKISGDNKRYGSVEAKSNSLSKTVGKK